MNPGIYDLSNDEYHSCIGLSRSGLMLFKKSPLHYWYEYLNPIKPKKESTHALILGEALHTYTLERDLFFSRFYVAPKIDKRTTDGKKLWAEIDILKGNRHILTPEEFEKITLMAESINSNYTAENLITGAQYEKSLFWNDPETRVLCKARPDITHDFMMLMADLKTTENASERAFQNSIYSYGYHIQAAMQIDAAKYAINKTINDFVFIAIEKEPPFAVAVYVLSKASIDAGRREYKKLLSNFKECLDKNEWPGYQTTEISLPNYAL